MLLAKFALEVPNSFVGHHQRSHHEHVELRENASARASVSNSYQVHDRRVEPRSMAKKVGPQACLFCFHALLGYPGLK